MSVPAAVAPVAAIEIAGLRFRWRPGESWVLGVPAFQLAAGERVFIGGPSGSGKSTLLSLIAGVAVPQAGSLRVLGVETSRLSGARRDRFRADHLGIVFQLFNLLPYLSVIDNVLLPCRFSARRAIRARERSGSAVLEAHRLLERLGLEAALSARSASDLSVGQQQRVAAARALIGSPDLIIADEPTSALDADLRSAFVELMLEQCASVGSALLFVSHDRSLAARFDRKVEFLALVEAGPKATV